MVSAERRLSGFETRCVFNGFAPFRSCSFLTEIFRRELGVHQKLQIRRRVLCSIVVVMCGRELITRGPEPGAWVLRGERGLGAPPSSSRAFCAQPSSLVLAACSVPRRCQQECAYPLLTIFSAACWTDVWGFVRDWFGIILSFLDPEKFGLLHRSLKTAPLTAVPGLKVATPSFRVLRL